MFWPLLLYLWSLLPPLPSEPPITLADLAAFPPRHVVQHHLAASRQSRERWQLLACIDATHAAELDIACTESSYLFRCWDTLDDAHAFSSNDSPEQALSALRRLRCLIGYARYYGADMPPPVAFWWHPRAD